MPLTPKQQFRLGFLAKCAEAGLKPEEVKEFVKQAWINVGPKEIASAASTAAWPAYAIPIASGLITFGAGGVLGHHLAKSMQPQEPPVEDIKRQELKAALQRHAERFRRNTRERRYREGTGEAPSMPRLPM